MGNQPSLSDDKNPQPAYHGSKEIRKEIRDTRIKLHQVKIEGLVARDAREEELYDLQMKLYEKKKLLMEKAKHAQDSYSFTDYINIIQTTYSSDKVAVKPVQTIIPDDGVRPKTTDIVPQHFKLTYTIFAWFEAYLLKRLHMAMLQKKQQSIHSQSWSGVVADLYFEIPKVKKNFESKLGGLFVRKQNVEMEKHQKYSAYAEHVRTQASAIMKLEKASWDEHPLNQSKRLSLPTMISIQEAAADHRYSGISTTTTADLSSPFASGRTSPEDAKPMSPNHDNSRTFSKNSFVTADSDRSEGVAALTREMDQIKESPHLAQATSEQSSRTSSPFDGFESDITESSEEEDSIYESTDDEFDASERANVDQPSAIAVRALNAQPHRISSMTVPEDFHWHAKKQKEERERMRKEALAENARLQRERILQKTEELRTKSFDSGPIDLKKISSGDSDEIERLKRLQELREAKEKARLERAAFKAARLKDLQNRLARTSGHSPVSRSEMSGSPSGTSTEREKMQSILDQLPEKKTEEEGEGDTTTAAASTLSKGEPVKPTKKKQKKKKKSSASGGSTDDKSIQSNTSSSGPMRKSAKRKSQIAAEKRAQAKMERLSQVMTSETLQSYVQEQEQEEKVKSPSAASMASRASRRSIRLDETIRKAEEKANQKLAELVLLSDGGD